MMTYMNDVIYKSMRRTVLKPFVGQQPPPDQQPGFIRQGMDVGVGIKDFAVEMAPHGFRKGSARDLLVKD